MIVWEARLVEAMARRRAVLVIGSGVSRNSVNSQGDRPLSWDGFLKMCCSELRDPPHIVDTINSRDFLLGCQLLKSAMGRDAFIERVQREFQLKGFRAASIHSHLYQLDAPITLSPNFDNIYDDYCRNTSAGSYVIKTHASTDIANYLNSGDRKSVV